ncbi:MAG: polysaccharide deacetylase family protein [Flavobacteriales bacterium]|nr:polysaccharide deacetylase family protein [Flavobacteriales bacterium]MBP7409622.1 polysaccharide deacetylase family protein [Flavobacteriales bacterium]
MRLLPALLFLAALQVAAQDKRVVITIDDLPCISCSGRPWDQVTNDLLRALKDHRVPAIGFVNEDKLEVDGALDSARYQLLERWLDAGMELGNHTYAHRGATRTTAAEFEQDVVQGERHLRPLLQRHGQELRYFRHPFLQTGATPQRRDSLNTMLARYGYTVAPVTFDNDEYIYAYCYDRACRAADDSTMRLLAEGYLTYMADVTRFHEQQARDFFGREIPHILLIHANTLNAAQLDGLLTWFEQEGYRFISLEEALKDACYQLPEATTRYGFSWIRRWQLASGQEPPWPPEIPEEVQKRYDALRN